MTYHNDATDDRILALLQVMAPEDVADNLSVRLEDVLALQKADQKSHRRVTLRCGRTGRVWHLYSWRQAYFNACLKGLSDWTWHKTEDYEQWLASQPGEVA